MKARFTMGAGLLLGLAGCDAMVELQTIVGLRVLGARVEAAEDGSVAEPGSGSAARVEWLVVSDRTETYAARFQACETTRVATDLPECSGEPFHDERRAGDTTQELAFEFQLPRLAPQTEWLAKLAVCAKGRAEFSANGVARCSDGSTALEAQTRVLVGDAEANRHPNLEDDELTLDGRAWTASGAEAIGAGCDEVDTELPSAQRGEAVSIRWRSRGEDRETLPEALSAEYGAKGKETLLLAHFATLPGLDRPFSGIDDEGHSFELDFVLDRKASVERSGTVAGFVLVVRDDRGGIDWTRRRFCARR